MRTVANEKNMKEIMKAEQVGQAVQYEEFYCSTTFEVALGVWSVVLLRSNILSIIDSISLF